MKAKTDVEKWIDSQLPIDGVQSWRNHRIERLVTIDGDKYYHTKAPDYTIGRELTEAELWKIRSFKLDAGDSASVAQITAILVTLNEACDNVI